MVIRKQPNQAYRMRYCSKFMSVLFIKFTSMRLWGFAALAQGLDYQQATVLLAVCDRF